MKHNNNPKYAVIKMALNDQDESFTLDCPIGSFIGFEVQLIQSGAQDVQEGLIFEWKFSTSVLRALTQTAKMVDSVWVQAGDTLTGTHSRYEFGWASVGETKICIVAKCGSKVFKRQGIVSVHGPDVQLLRCERQETGQNLAIFTLQSSITSRGYSGSTGYIQLTTTKIPAKKIFKSPILAKERFTPKKPTCKILLSRPGLDQIIQNIQRLEVRKEVKDEVDEEVKYEVDLTKVSLTVPTDTDARVYLSIQPDVCSPIITKTFIVKYDHPHVLWNSESINTKNHQAEWNLATWTYSKLLRL